MAETAVSGPALLGPRITDDLLARLAGLTALAAVDGPREQMAVEMPATGQVLGHVPRCTADDVAAAARAARKAQAGWAHIPVAVRAQVLLRFATLLLARQDELLDLIQLENGKARRHAFEEIIDVAQTSRYYARTAPRFLAPHRRAGALPVLTRTWERHHPKGVIGVISPWNYPLTLGISDALPALVAGNAVVAKPDSQTPYTALRAAELLAEAGLPTGVLQVVTGAGSELGGPLTEHCDFVMFTGSTRVGRIVAVQAAHRLIDYSMELGGKNAILVLADADLDRAVPGAVRAAFSNTGQLCISMERMYVDEAIWDDFVPRFVAATKELRLGHSLRYDADLGSLISAAQLDTVTRHVDDAVGKGATVLAGGRARPDIGPYFYEPTILTGVAPGMTAYAEETFGPVISVYRVSGPDEAVRLANDSRYGLNFSVWTRDVREGRRIASLLEAGTVNVNEAYAATWGSVDAPMGGWKDSGVGSRHGEHGILKYTDSQTVSVQRLLPIAPPGSMQADTYAKVMTAAMRALQALPGRK
ncbi:MAG TPA: succinic semialdehyde dehydrogenase [Streptosporangiaceae bacterium]|nr:succinic semialdehyde dehydrogenase [Streptosporangiaceae bacterium]